MSQVTIDIAGRSFEVVCEPGEEDYLKAAAAMLDEEAQKLDGTATRIPESRMLLMAGLLLADRTAAMEDQVANGATQSAPPADDDAMAEFESRQRASDLEVASLQGRVAELTQEMHATAENTHEKLHMISQERDAAMATVEEMVNQVKSLVNPT